MINFQAEKLTGTILVCEDFAYLVLNARIHRNGIKNTFKQHKFTGR